MFAQIYAKSAQKSLVFSHIVPEDRELYALKTDISKFFWQILIYIFIFNSDQSRQHMCICTEVQSTI